MCQAVLLIDVWMQEIFHGRQEHIHNFVGIRLGLEVVVYKSYYWGYQ